MVGSGGGMASAVASTASDFGTGTGCRRKLRTSFSRDESRVTRSSTPRFTVFAFASATNGRMKITINRPMMNRIKSSICLLYLAA